MAEDFILMTDSNCDLPVDYYKQHDIAVLPMSYIIDNVTYYESDRTPKEFYDMLRAGKVSTTAGANTEEIKAVMEPHIKEGKDVLYLAFSSGASNTAHNGERAVQELSEKYPERKIICVDSLSLCMGEGLFVYLANRLKQTGASIDEVAEWALNNRLKVAHYFLLDDLMYAHRGGRVSRTSAIAGSMMGIKPVLHVNDEGKLIALGKARSKKKAIIDLVDRLEKCVGDSKPDFFMVGHGDCEEDAKFAIELMSKRFGINDYITGFIGCVIGTHSGPGTIALFIMAEHR